MTLRNSLDRRQFIIRSATALGSSTTFLGCSKTPTERGNGAPETVEATQPLKADPAAQQQVEQPAAESGWGDLSGRLVYDGTAPERKKLVVDKDVECCGEHDIRDESLMVGQSGGLANVYVYLRGRCPTVSPELIESVEKQVVLDNRDCIFMPHCMKLWVGRQKLNIINSDPVAQNVAFSPMLDVPANIVLPVDGEADWTFNRSQRKPVAIACNYHPWESAYILPVDHPYVALTDSEGRFTIPKLPAGRHEFQVWHERTDYLDTSEMPSGRFTIDIRPGENQLDEVRLSPALFV